MSETAGQRLRALHIPGKPFVLANAWDVGSARMLAALGAEAIGTSSSAHAFTLGRPDGQVTRDEALAHAEVLVAATPLPVSGDFESGFGREPEVVARTVELAGSVGLAGISIEDTTEDGGTFEHDLAVERIVAAVEAARSLDDDFVLLARTDGVLRGNFDLDEGIRRLQAFEAVGPDGLYLPPPPSLDDLRRICESVSLPVNALATAKLTAATYDDMAKAGAARISLGGGLARLSHRTIVDAATAMFESGDFSALAGAMSGAETDPMLAAGSADA